VRRIVVFTHSAGFRHSYIPAAVEVIVKLGERSGAFEALATEECEELKRFVRSGDVSGLVFLTTGEIPLGDDGLNLLIEFVEAGGGFVGVHNAADTLYSYARYGEMLGGYFNGHPWTQEVGVVVEDQSHPSTRHLPARIRVLEEVYTFRDWERKRTRVLMSLDNSTVDLSKGTRGDNDYALAWCHGFGRGRVFYTAFGHFTRLWREEWFQKHLLGGILWALRLEE